MVTLEPLSEAVAETWGMPPSFGSDRSIRAMNAAKLLACEARARGILPVLNGPVIVLKGALLGEELYGDRLFRPTTDIDLLLSADALVPAIRRMEELGYERLHPKPRPWATNQFALKSPLGLPIVELHWRLALPAVPSPAFEDLMDRARPREWAGHEVRVLCPSDLLVHLVLHFQQHGGHLKGVLDIAAWIDRFGHGPAWRSGTTSLRRLGLQTALIWALRLIDLAAGTEMARSFEDFGAADVLVGHSHEIFSSGATELDEGLEFFRLLALHLGSLDRPAARRRYLLRSLLAGPHRVGGLLGPLVDPFLSDSASNLVLTI